MATRGKRGRLFYLVTRGRNCVQRKRAVVSARATAREEFRALGYVSYLDALSNAYVVAPCLYNCCLGRLTSSEHLISRIINDERPQTSRRIRLNRVVLTFRSADRDFVLPNLMYTVLQIRVALPEEVDEASAFV